MTEEWDLKDSVEWLSFKQDGQPKHYPPMSLKAVFVLTGWKASDATLLSSLAGKCPEHRIPL